MAQNDHWERRHGGATIRYDFNDTYRASLMVVKNATDSTIEWLNEQYCLELKNPPLRNCNGRAWWVEKDSIGVIGIPISESRDRVRLMETLGHELTHWVMMLCESRGISPDASNDEPIAYLMGWAMRRSAWVLDRK